MPHVSAAEPCAPRGRVLAPIYGAGFVTAFAAYAVAANLGGYSLQHHTSLWQLGVLLGIYDVAEIVLKPLFGNLSDLVGPKPVMIGGLVAFALASAGFVAAGQVQWLGAARLAQGAAAAAFSPASGAALAALGGRKRTGRLFGGYGGAKSLGYLAGPLVGGLLVTASGYASMGYSRGASAIGVAKALGEIGAEVGERHVLKDWTLYSCVASCSAGIELMHNVVILVGNSAFSSSPFRIGHAVMRDAIDLPAVMRALESVGLGAFAAPSQGELVNILAKAEASPDGAIRGLRHTMLEDSDINATRHARAAVGGLIGGVAGTGAVYVSGGAEHQGPAGGGPVAIIARV